MLLPLLTVTLAVISALHWLLRTLFLTQSVVRHPIVCVTLAA